jgi:hypothetical protein
MQVLAVWKCVRARLREISDGAEKGESIAQFRLGDRDKRNDYNRRYHLQNKHKRFESNRQYDLDNADRKREYDREYHRRHKAKISESKRLYYVQNQDLLQELTRRYSQQHKDKIRDVNRQHRVRNHSNPEAYLPRNIESKSWKSPDLVREYFESITHQLHISNFSDWYRISTEQLKDLEGASSCGFFFLITYQLGGYLLFKFGSLSNALQYAYPEFDWDLSKFSLRGKKSEQRWLKVNVEELLPGIEIVEEFQHTGLQWDKGTKSVSFLYLLLLFCS